jgi:hypothetical protein
VDWIRGTALVVIAMGSLAQGAAAQDRPDAEAAYFRAVAEFFRVPASEMAIMRDWRLPADEIPVVLFVANRAGVSPEALAALRRSGQGWHDLASRYGVGADALHVPIPENASAGRLEGVYERFRSTSTGEWSDVVLASDDVVALVNVRLLSQTLGVPPAEILRRAGTSTSFVALYGELIS